jgi:transposase
MDGPTVFVGIDVAKGWLDVAERPSGRVWRVANDEAGWAALVGRLRALGGPLLIVLEASGGYEVGAALALDAAGLTPAVVNPVASRRFAQSLGRRAKTDKLDAEMLAAYAERMRPPVRPLPAETARTLRALVAHREHLTGLLVAERNRRRQADAAVAAAIDDLVAVLAAQREAVAARMRDAVAADPAWAERVALLDTIPGFGFLSAVVLAAGVPELGRCTGKEVGSLVGAVPYSDESGTGGHGRRIAGGRAEVRHALFEAVMTTVRCDPTFKAHYAQLKARGKTHKQAIIACLRRLLGIATAMVREHLTWQETKVGQGTFAPPQT